MSTSMVGTCRVGNDPADRPCELVVVDEAPLKSWYVYTCATSEEAFEQLGEQVALEVHAEGKEFVGSAMFKRTHNIAVEERSKYYPVGVELRGTGPLKEAE